MMKYYVVRSQSADVRHDSRRKGNTGGFWEKVLTRTTSILLLRCLCISTFTIFLAIYIMLEKKIRTAEAKTTMPKNFELFPCKHLWPILRAKTSRFSNTAESLFTVLILLRVFEEWCKIHKEINITLVTDDIPITSLLYWQNIQNRVLTQTIT